MWLLLAWCLASPPAQAQSSPRNVLLLLADDLGVDLVAAYNEHPDPARTPRIDQLANHGVLFRNAWSNPLCSPTRAGILTGRHAFRTGAGTAVGADDSWSLPLSEQLLPETLPPAVKTALVGKWHLTMPGPGALSAPLAAGFDHFRGTVGNLPGNIVGNGYFSYTKSVDGVAVPVTRYATSETVDDALAVIASFGTQRWFVMVSFHAAHVPLHKPPAHLHTYALPADVSSSMPLHARAMVEALDTEIGRLLDSLPASVLANTVVVLSSDNGTISQAATPPSDPAKAKKTLYEGGVHVPLVVAGAGIAAGRECGALVHTVDLFATVQELCGGSPVPGAVDAVSLVPYLSDPGLPSLRAVNYTEIYSPNGLGTYHNHYSHGRAVRNQRFKLVVDYAHHSSLPASARMHDLVADPREEVDLLAAPLDTFASAGANQLVAALKAFAPPTWQAVGTGKPGSYGVPRLELAGTLLPGSPLALDITAAPPHALAALFVGLSVQTLPLLGDTLLTTPDVLHWMVLDAAGELHRTPTFPALPAELGLVFQVWIADPGAAYGWSATRGLIGTVP